MKIAVIGFGNWGEKLVNSLSGFKNIIDYLCVVDIDKSKKEKAKKYRLDFFLSYRQVYEKVDAFIIASWENTHYKIAKDCLLKNKHVLVEKPLAINYQEAKELVKIAQKNRLTLMVDNTFLFDKSFLFLKDRIEKNQIGLLFKIDSIRFSSNIIKPFTNIIVDLLPHDISIFYSLFKKQPFKINCDRQTLVNEYCDNAQIKMNFGSVVTCSFLSWTFPLNRREMIFYGSKRILLWQKKDINTDSIVCFKYNKRKKAKIEERIEMGDKGKVLEKVLSEFLLSILNKREPRTSGEKVLPEVKLLEEVLKKV